MPCPAVSPWDGAARGPGPAQHTHHAGKGGGHTCGRNILQGSCTLPFLVFTLACTLTASRVILSILHQQEMLELKCHVGSTEEVGGTSGTHGAQVPSCTSAEHHQNSTGARDQGHFRLPTPQPAQGFRRSQQTQELSSSLAPASALGAEEPTRCSQAGNQE